MVWDAECHVRDKMDGKVNLDLEKGNLVEEEFRFQWEIRPKLQDLSSPSIWSYTFL
jgi:hypothetical protein